MRLLQTHLLLAMLPPGDRRSDAVRVVLLGDMNAHDDEPAIELVSARLKDAYRAVHPDADGFTWLERNPYLSSAPLPSRRIDYIFVSPVATVHRAEVVLDRCEPVCPSDHFAVLAELEWPRHQFVQTGKMVSESKPEEGRHAGGEEDGRLKPGGDK